MIKTMDPILYNKLLKVNRILDKLQSKKNIYIKKKIEATAVRLYGESNIRNAAAFASYHNMAEFHYPHKHTLYRLRLLKTEIEQKLLYD